MDKKRNLNEKEIYEEMCLIFISPQMIKCFLLLYSEIKCFFVCVCVLAMRFVFEIHLHTNEKRSTVYVHNVKFINKSITFVILFYFPEHPNANHCNHVALCYICNNVYISNKSML